MALIVTKEDGSGLTNSNSYATVAEADAYFEGHLYGSVWTAAGSTGKPAALVMASRLIDSVMQFHGYRSAATQAMQWPRERCPDPDSCLVTVSPLVPVGAANVVSLTVPVAVRWAAIEMARELILRDRTAAAAGEGLDSVVSTHTTHESTGSGSETLSSTTKYDKSDTPGVLSGVALALLCKYGDPRYGGGPVRLQRV